MKREGENEVPTPLKPRMARGAQLTAMGTGMKATGANNKQLPRGGSWKTICRNPR